MTKFLMLQLLFATGFTTLWSQSGKVYDNLSLHSDILNMDRRYAVYLPPDYESSGRNYPVLYLLHGAGDDQTGWVQFGEVLQIADQSIKEGTATPMIVIMPDANTGQRGYFNSIDGKFRYEDFFFEELMPHVEQKFRIKRDKRYRAVAGLSMGGGGATGYAQRHPDMYCAVYAMSALMNIPAGSENPTPNKDDKMSILTRSVMENSCIKYVEQANDAQKAQLRSVQWFIDCGDDDFLLDRNIEFTQAMRKAQIPFQFRVRDGGHTSEYWHSALYTCLPFISRVFTR